MAQRTVVQLEDDLEGGEAAETVAFGLDGTSYEIDLNEDNAAALREALEQFIAAARRVGGGRGGARRGGGRPSRQAAASAGSDPDPKTVRAWAQEHDVPVSPRGRIPQSVVAQFLEATG